MVTLFRSLCWSAGLWLWLLAAPALAQEAGDKADVRVIIDISGSMKQNDPDNLRRPALDLLINLIPEGSQAGVWTFGQYVNMLVPHQVVNAAWRKQAAAQVQKVNSVGLFTNIGGALERAHQDGGPAQPGYRTNIILLTDGMVDISRAPEDNLKEWRRIVDQVLPSLQGQQVKIHTVALSDKADRDLMNALSLSTDGIVAVADNAEDLARIFMQALAQSAPVDELPLTENSFLVDSSIEEFTALIFRAKPDQQTRLLAPDKQYYQADTQDQYLRWHRAPDHDLVTLAQPIEGEWKVLADLDPDSKITIVTNLRLLVKPMGNNLFVGEQAELQFLLQEQDKTLADARFLRLLAIGAQLERAGETLWSETLSDALPPGDGIYRRTISGFDQEGDYLLTLRIDGGSFKREFKHRFAVRGPFAVSLQTGEDGSRLLQVSANGQSLDRARTQVVAKVREPGGRASIQPLVLGQTDQWELLLKPEAQGNYQVDLRISAMDLKGAGFEHQPEPVRFRHPEGDDPFTGSADPLDLPAPAEPVVDAPDVAQQPEPSAPEPSAQAEAPPAQPEAEGDQWVLYGALAAGNLLILALAWFAYRVIMGKNQEAEAEADDEPVPAGNKPVSALDDLAASRKTLADDLMAPLDDMADAIDLEDDAATDLPLDTGSEFSLDDLAPDKDRKDS